MYKEMNDVTVQQVEQLPTKITVKIKALHISGPMLAVASVNLNGVFTVRGIKIIDGERDPFVSMPSFKTRFGYRDTCFPCTSEFYEQFRTAVLDAYQQELTQSAQRGEHLSVPALSTDETSV